MSPSRPSLTVFSFTLAPSPAINDFRMSWESLARTSALSCGLIRFFLPLHSDYPILVIRPHYWAMGRTIGSGELPHVVVGPENGRQPYGSVKNNAVRALLLCVHVLWGNDYSVGHRTTTQAIAVAPHAGTLSLSVRTACVWISSSIIII